MSKVPKKSVVELCNFLECEINRLDAKGIDYLSFLRDKALNLQEKIVGSEIDEPAHFFVSTKFTSLQNLLQNFRQIKASAAIKLEDYLRSQAQDKIDQMAMTLLLLWPTMEKFSKDELPSERVMLLKPKAVEPAESDFELAQRL